MSTRHALSMLAAMGVVCWSWAVSAADPVGSDAIERRQVVQQRARDEALELLSSVLDVQLQQLEQNGLADRPLYREIALMRRNIGTLVDEQMQQVIDVLASARKGTAAEREQAFHEARKMIRTIVNRLSVERQNLRRRLKTAELAAEIRQIVDRQSRVHKATRELPDLGASQQEKAALQAIEDQRDVRQLYLQFVDTLTEVAGWGGELGAAAADGARILTTSETSGELDQSSRSLDELRFAEAARAQERALRGLRQLLEKFDAPSTAPGSEQNSNLDAVRDLIRRQEQVRGLTKQTDLNGPDAGAVVDQQAALRNDLNQFAETLEGRPEARDLADRARAAAYEATARLFDSKKDEALQQQGKVLGNLAALAEELAHAAPTAGPDKSAADLERQIHDLEQAKAEMEKVRQRQGEAHDAAQDKPAAARRAERDVADGVAKVDDGKSLPEAVMSRLNAAEQAARDAEKSLADANKADPTAQNAVSRADRAVERAQSEIDAALNDARRQAQAVKIGELSRAVETLERAAGAEREIAEEARAASRENGLDAEAAKRLAEEQKNIEEIARKVREGVRETAPAAADPLDKAARDAEAGAKDLNEAAKEPGEKSKSPAQSAAEKASAAAREMARAAERLRDEIATAAKELAAESDRQLEDVLPARDATETALEGADSRTAAQLQRLQEAKKAVREAEARQQHAAGRPRAAEAMRLADSIADALAAQDDADAAARALADGQASSPLEAMAREQEVADQASKAAEKANARRGSDEPKGSNSSDAVASALEQASKAAARAARGLLDNEPARAETARAEARAALERALKAAQAEAQQASQAPGGQPDGAAQKQVGEKAARARELAAGDAPEAAGALDQAARASETAGKQLESENAAGAAAAQREASQQLRQASERLDAAIRQMASRQSKELADRSQKAAELAAGAAPVDPAALAALRGAEDAARQASASKSGNPSQAQAGQQRAQRETERATAMLNAREQRIRRDRSVAETIQSLARDQQSASSEISQARDELLESSDATNASGDPNAAQADSEARRQAAQKMSDAQSRFADAQRATGQAAEEVSGQSQVANAPLREALEMASKLSAGRGGSQPGDHAGQGSQEGSAPGDGQEGSQSVGGDASGASDGDSSLGTGFVPNSPEVTADMMAGQSALAQAHAALGGEGRGKGKGKGKGQGKGKGDHEGDHQGAGRGKGGSASGGNSGNSSSVGGDAPPPGALLSGPLQAMDVQSIKATDVRGGGGGDSAPASRSFGEESWMSRLPPELRQAIRARAQRRAPRDYEERLNRYFESLE